MQKGKVLKTNNLYRKHVCKEEKDALHNEIEEAYLEKEISRMYERLAKSGKNTAVISEKLTKLKKSQMKK